MIKARWQLGLEEEAAELRLVATLRRVVTGSDPASDAIEFCAGRLDGLARRLMEPTRRLTCEEWAAEQDPAVSGKTARRWIRAGALDAIETTQGYRILAGTRRSAPLPDEEEEILLTLAEGSMADADGVDDVPEPPTQDLTREMTLEASEGSSDPAPPASSGPLARAS